jgi:hypothetical protein
MGIVVIFIDIKKDIWMRRAGCLFVFRYDRWIEKISNLWFNKVCKNLSLILSLIRN